MKELIARHLAEEAARRTEDQISVPHPCEISHEFREWCLRHGVTPEDPVFAGSLTLAIRNYTAHALRVAQHRSGLLASEMAGLGAANAGAARPFMRPPVEKPGTPSDLPMAAAIKQARNV